MTAFDIIVPLVALSVAGIGIALLRRQTLALRPEKHQHPAE